MPNQRATCRHCKKKEARELMTKHPGGWFCDNNHAYLFAIENRQKGVDIAKKEIRREKREYNKRDLKRQKESTQKAFNQMIRIIDAEEGCSTCRQPLGILYDAGHVRSVGSMPALRFDARNCFAQCRACNGTGIKNKKFGKSQDVVSNLYKDWILKNKGQAYHDWLYGPHEEKHYTCEQLIEMRKEFNAEIRRLKQGLPPSKDWRALPE